VILVADEGVDGAVVERLRRDGHDVLYVAELSPSAQMRNRALLRLDLYGRRPESGAAALHSHK